MAIHADEIGNSAQVRLRSGHNKPAFPESASSKNGRGEFYDQESINGKTILVRFSIWGITPDTAQSEQAFSADGGKTWEINWINKYTRLSP